MAVATAQDSVQTIAALAELIANAPQDVAAILNLDGTIFGYSLDPEDWEDKPEAENQREIERIGEIVGEIYSVLDNVKDACGAPVQSQLNLLEQISDLLV